MENSSREDAIEFAERCLKAAWIPATNLEIKEWFDNLGIPVPVGAHPLMHAFRMAAIRAAEAGRQTACPELEHQSTPPNPERIVTLPLSQYMDLYERSMLLLELEDAGVDNWHGYDNIDRRRMKKACRVERNRIIDGKGLSE